MSKRNIVLFMGHCLFFIFLAGCATEYNIATGKQETIFYSTAKEVRIGKSISKRVDEEFDLIADLELERRLNSIGEKIVKVCDRKEIDYHFRVVDFKEEDKKEDDQPEINAFALPGGFVYIFVDLMDIVRSDDELAGVLAHEVGHIVARHSIKKLQASMGYMLVRIASLATNTGGFGSGIDVAFQQIMLGYGREDELLADKLAVQYMERAGYDPEQMISFLQLLSEVKKKAPITKFSYNRTHPYISDRIAQIKRSLGLPLDIEDVVNMNEE